MLIAESMGFKSKTVSTLKEMVATIETNKNFKHSAYCKTWDKWSGNEIDYYKQCYKMFKRLNKVEIKKKLGPELTRQIESVKKLHHRMKEHLIPQQLQFDEQKWKKFNYKEDINSIDLWLLRLFNGKRKTEQVIKKALLFNVSISKTIENLMKEGILSEVK